MKVLIIGNNRKNDHVREYFSREGMEVVVISDIYELRSLKGEVGNFMARTKNAEPGLIDVDIVIVSEQPSAEPVEIDGLKTDSLYTATPAQTQRDGCSMLPPAKEPIVFLLDYVNESPMAATVYALNDAAAFARNKRSVYYLSKFVRTAERGVENAYKQAREAGVTFIKYDDVQVAADLNDETFTFTVSDGEINLEIKTKNVIADSGNEVGKHFSYVTEKLNLTQNKNGYVTEDRFFQSPALTSRRGVYHLTRDMTAERLDEALDFIYNHAVSARSFKSPDCEQTVAAEIDGNKCAFCYNCFRVCPHAALEPDLNESQMQCLTAACAGCGTCAGICPANAITLKENVVPAEVVAKAKSLVICCENSKSVDDSLERFDNFGDIDFLYVSCGGLIDTTSLSESLIAYDKVMAVVCPDDACRHFHGNKRACAQTKHLKNMMEAAGLASDRLKIVQVSQAMPKVLQEELRRFCTKTAAEEK